jgi:hypothetical protein
MVVRIPTIFGIQASYHNGQCATCQQTDVRGEWQIAQLLWQSEFRLSFRLSLAFRPAITTGNARYMSTDGCAGRVWQIAQLLWQSEFRLSLAFRPAITTGNARAIANMSTDGYVGRVAN